MIRPGRAGHDRAGQDRAGQDLYIDGVLVMSV